MNFDFRFTKIVPMKLRHKVTRQSILRNYKPSNFNLARNVLAFPTLPTLKYCVALLNAHHIMSNI